MKGDSAGNMLHNCRCYCASAYGGGSGCLGLGAVGNRPSIIHSARPSGWERCRGGGCGWLWIRSCVGWFVPDLGLVFNKRWSRARVKAPCRQGA